MTRHRQRVEVGHDIGDMREEDVTCVDVNFEDVASTWKRPTGRDIVVNVNFEGETSTWA